MEKMWLLLSIVTFLIALYWAYRNGIYDALYFFGFSGVASILFLLRRKQRRFHERNELK